MFKASNRKETHLHIKNNKCGSGNDYFYCQVLHKHPQHMENYTKEGSEKKYVAENFLISDTYF